MFSAPEFDAHEQVVFCHDPAAGLDAIIAIHDTTLGPALGGVRTWVYHSLDDAVGDALQLSRAMTLKAALAGLDAGGGKAVIMEHSEHPRESRFRAFGRFLESLGGRLICGEGMGTTSEDLSYIRRESRWVAGGGDAQESRLNAEATAWGVFHGIRAALEVVHGSPSLEGRRVAIQGVGAVGGRLARYLHEAGADLSVVDTDSRRVGGLVESLGATPLDPEEFFSADCDVLAPCAVGGILNPHTIPLIRAPVVAGAANHQLLDEKRDAAALASRGITYVPDFATNTGALIRASAEVNQRDHARAMRDTQRIFDVVKRVMDRARSDGGTTVQAAQRLALDRIEAVARVKGLYLPRSRS